MDSMAQAFHDGIVSHAIIIYFTNAFDRVQHILLSDEIVLWLMFSGRLFTFKAGLSPSTPRPILNAAPQESVLGPVVLFT